MRNHLVSIVEAKFDKTELLKPAPATGRCLIGTMCQKKSAKSTHAHRDRLDTRKTGKKRDARKELLVTRRAQFAVAYN